MHLQGSQTLDLRGLLFPLNHSPEEYSNWSLPPVPPRHDFFTKEIHRLLQGGRKWSQSPVLPWAQRAYDARLSAGSTAKNWSPHPELHRAGFHTKEVHRSKCFGGAEIGVPDRLRSGDLLHERQACCLDYTTGTEMERVNGIAPLSRPWHGRILLLNHTRKKWCPQPDFHRQPDA